MCLLYLEQCTLLCSTLILTSDCCIDKVNFTHLITRAKLFVSIDISAAGNGGLISSRRYGFCSYRTVRTDLYKIRVGTVYGFVQYTGLALSDQ